MGHGGRRARRSREVGAPEPAPSAPIQSTSPSHARLLPSPPPVSGNTTPAPYAASPPLAISPTPMAKAPGQLSPARPGEPGDGRRTPVDGLVAVIPKRPRVEPAGEDGGIS